VTASIWHDITRYLQEIARYYAIPVIVMTWLFVKALPSKVRALRGCNWAIAQGCIETVSVNTINAQAEFATAILGYSYRVEGELYSGYYSQQFGDEQDAWDYANNLKHKTVAVRCKPGHPETSVLRSQDQSSELKLRPDSKRFVAHFHRLLKKAG
jgi:hypothetical protein